MFGQTSYNKLTPPKIRKEEVRIVIVDDNFTVRNVLRSIIQTIGHGKGSKLNLFTSEDGVQGLGYSFIIKPDILVIDATLPKYSGREVVDYLMTNTNFSPDSENHLILLTDEKKKIPPNSNYLVFDKSSPKFVNNITESLSEIITGESPKLDFRGKLMQFFSSSAVRWANRSDLLGYRFASIKFFVFKLLLIPILIILQYIASLNLTALKIFKWNISDDNIAQRNNDEMIFRTRYYPSFFAAFTILTILFLQLSLSFGGILFLFRGSPQQSTAAGWYNASWTYRKKLTIDHTYYTTNGTNQPIVVTFSSETDLGADAQNDCDDILFTDTDGTTKIDHEVEKCVDGGPYVFWVQIPSISSTVDVDFYMYYGNASASAQENETATWDDTTYIGVWHLEDYATQNDSSSNGNNGAAAGGIDSSDLITTGIAGNAVNFDSAGSDRLTMGDPVDGSLDITTGDFTLSAWVRTTTTSSMQILSKGANTTAGYRMYMNGSLSSRAGFKIQGTVDSVDTTPGSYTNNLTNGSWHQVLITFDRNGNATVYKDGVSTTATANISSVDGESLATDNAFTIGRYAGGQYFNGDIDEVRIYNAALNADYIKRQYTSQAVNVFFVGAEETDGAVTVSASGTQNSTILTGATNEYIGGKFVFTNTGSSRSVTGITLTENGSVAANVELDNIKLYWEVDTSAPYDCASESYGGSESQFGSTDTDGFSAANGTSAFTSAGFTTTTTQTGCVYVVLDSLAGHGTTIEIEIANAATNVTLSSGTAGPASSVALSGTTTGQAHTVVSAFGTQTTTIFKASTNQYAGGGFAIASNSGTRNVTSIKIGNFGTVAAAGTDNTKLFYEIDNTAPYDCASESYAGSETQYGSTDTNGFEADQTTTFSGSVQITTTNTMCVYLVLDITSSAADGSTLELTIENSSSDIVTSAGYVGPSTTVNVTGTTNIEDYDVLVGTSGSQSTTGYKLDTNFYLGGQFTITNITSGTKNLEGITLTESGTINGSTGLDNIILAFDSDTSNPYDCASESFSGNETFFGTADTDGFSAANGTSSITGSTSMGDSSALCFYVFVDITSSASASETIEISIANPSTDIDFTSHTASPATSVEITGATTVANPGWYNTSWTRRKKITVDETKVGGGFWETNFPILINHTDTALQNYAQADGDDILFTSADGVTKLDHELEKYTSASGTVVAWLRAPRLSNISNTTFYIYYANSSASAQENETATWNSSLYKGVWHMAEDPSGGAPQINDSSNNGNNGTSAGTMTSGDLITDGQMGNAINFDGSNDAISMGDPANGSLEIGTEDFTMQVWVRTTSASSMHLLAKGASGDDGYRIYMNSSQSSRVGFRLDGTTDFVDTTPGSYSNTLTNGSWHMVHVTFDRNGNAEIFNDGVSKITASIATVDGESTANASPFYIARYGAGQYFTGDIDEARLVNGALSTNWIATEYNSHSSPSTFYSLATEEVTNIAPTVTSVTVNSGSNITLSENTTTTVNWTATVTDQNGYADITSVIGRLYRSGVSGAEACDESNGNNCYADFTCDLSSCSGNSCTATCSASVQFYAEPTDTGSIYASEFWLGHVRAIDSLTISGQGFSPDSVTDVNTLRAINVTASINYGVVNPGSNTGSTNQTVTVTNTGNASVDLELSGTNLCTDYPACGGSVITVGHQEYSLNTFTFGAGTDLSTTPTNVNANISKPTQSPSNGTGTIYWGINVNSGLPAGGYSGQITVNAVSDN